MIVSRSFIAALLGAVLAAPGLTAAPAYADHLTTIRVTASTASSLELRRGLLSAPHSLSRAACAAIQAAACGFDQRQSLNTRTCSRKFLVTIW
jgi:hypothetical protein